VTQLIIIIIYLSLLLGLGLFASRLFRGTSKDYLLASHSIGPVLLLMSLFGTTMTAFALVGSTGEAYAEGVGVYGMLASSSGIIHSLCFFLIGVKLWSFGRRHGYTTQVQFFRDRLESDRIGLLLFPILVSLVIPYLLIGVIAAGTVISSVTEGAFANAFAAYDYGVPNWLGSLAVCGVVLIYVFFGGMRGTAWANTFQTLVFMVLGVITFFVISDKLGGLEEASTRVQEKHPSRLMRDILPEEEADYQTSLKKWETLAFYNYMVKEKGLKLDEQQIADAQAAFKPRMPNWKDRAAGAYAAKNKLVTFAPDSEEAQRARILQDDRVMPADGRFMDEAGEPLPLASFPRQSRDVWQAKAREIYGNRIGHPSEEGKWTHKKALGIYRAMNWSPEAPHPMGRLKFFTYLLVPLSVGMFPHLFQHWLTARKASTFKLAVVAHPIFIMIVWLPCVLVGVWATSAIVDGRQVIPPHFPPNAVLAMLVKQLSDPLLGGLLTAGILAAIMSSLDSQFLCIGTMFTTDIALHYNRDKEFTEKQKVMYARLFIVAIVAVTYGFSLFEPRRVFTLGVWCFSGFSSLFPLVVAAVYWRRLTKAGAYASILAAAGSWLTLFAMSDFGLNPNFTVAGMMPVVVMVAASLSALVLVSLTTKPPSEATLGKFFRN